MAERPNREVYVSLDGVIYLLLYNLYGLKYAAKVFNGGLVEHLRKGGSTQSLWMNVSGINGYPYGASSTYCFMLMTLKHVVPLKTLSMNFSVI